MKRNRKNYPAKFKAKVALEAIQEHESLAELSSKYEVHANMISNWKRQLKDGAADFLETKRGRKTKEDNELTDRLYRQIGQQQMELDWLKKKFGM